MSMISVVSLPRITAPKLAEMLLASINQPSSADTSSVAVVDVRDDGMFTVFPSLPSFLPFFLSSFITPSPPQHTHKAITEQPSKQAVVLKCKCMYVPH